MKLKSWLTDGVSILEIAQRAHRDLNESIATIDSARALSSLILRAHEQGAAPKTHLIWNSLQITFGAVALALRRFREDWSDYMAHLFEPDERPAEARDVIREIVKRSIVDAADALVAHSRVKGGPPLSSQQRVQLAMKTGWATQEELIAWYPTLCTRLMAVRDAITKKYPGADKYPETRDDYLDDGTPKGKD